MPINLTNDEYFGTYHLADNPANYQPATSNNFRFIVYGIDNLLRAGTRDEYVTGGQEIMDFSVTQVFIPHFQQEDISVARGNSTVHFAGKPSFQSGQIVINDFIHADGKSVLQAWQAQQYNVLTDVVYRVATTNYKKNCHLIEYTTDNEMIRYWELKGCWIQSLSEQPMSSTDNGARQVTASIVFDRAIPHMPDEELVTLG